MAHSYPHAFQLVADCCIWPLSEPRLAAIRTAADGSLDWPGVLRLAKRHRVEGLVHHALTEAGLAMPQEIAADLKGRADEILYRNLHLAGESVRLQRLFDKAGIPVLFVKGVSLAKLAYGTLALKHSKDIDLLVDPGDAEAAVRLLQSGGYSFAQFPTGLSERQRRIVLQGRDVSLVQASSGMEVELHWRPFENPLLLSDVGALCAARPVALSGEAAVRTLEDGDLFCYLCVHGAHHAWFRLKWLADVNAYLAGKSSSEIVNLHDLADRYRVGVCASLALLLCHQLFGLEIPAGLQSQLKLRGRLRFLHALALDLMAGPRAETEVYNRQFGTTRINISHFLLGRGWRFYLAECKAAMNARHDMLAYPLPAPFRFLYPILRIQIWVWRQARIMAGKAKGGFSP